MSNQCMHHLSASPSPCKGLLLSILNGWVPSGVLFIQLFACCIRAMMKHISRQTRVQRRDISLLMNSLLSRQIYFWSMIPLLTNSLTSSSLDYPPSHPYTFYGIILVVTNFVLSRSCTQLYFLWESPSSLPGLLCMPNCPHENSSIGRWLETHSFNTGFLRTFHIPNMNVVYCKNVSYLPCNWVL